MDRACEVGAMSEGNIPSKDGKAVTITFIVLYCIYCNFQKKSEKNETKLFEFSRDTGTEVLNIKKKRRHFAMALLCQDTVSHCNDTT